MCQSTTVPNTTVFRRQTLIYFIKFDDNKVYILIVSEVRKTVKK